MAELKINLQEVRIKVAEGFYSSLEESNRIWYGVLRLVITLSSSFLLLSIALVEKLFPPINGSINLSKFLITSWVLLFISIIFGIITEINEAIFHANQASRKAKYIKQINEKIARGLTEEIYREDDKTDYIVYNEISWGVISINSFILAILCLCLALLRKTIPGSVCFIFLALAIIALIFINIHFISKRKLK